MAQQTITLKAGSEQRITVPGKYVTVVSCTASFKIEADKNGRSVMVAGSNYGGQPFSRLTFIETSGSDNVITYDVSDAPSQGRAQVVQAGAASFVGPLSNSYDFGSAGGSVAGFQFPGRDSLGRERKSITVTNFGIDQLGGSIVTHVIVGYVNGGSFPAFAVFPNTSLTLETNADIIAYSLVAKLNSSPTHLQGAVLEIFYTKPLQTDA